MEDTYKMLEETDFGTSAKSNDLDDYTRTADSPGAEVEYEKTSAVQPLALIYEVKKYEILFNKQHSGFSDTALKEQTWDIIHSVLFPNYEQLNESVKNVIRRTVRKRWKSLRDALVKDHRLRTDNAAYRLKKMNPMVKEMQFLVPYIKYPSRNKTTDSNDNYDEGQHSPDFCKLMNDETIDLTFQEDNEDSKIQVDDDVGLSNEALYPSVRLTTSESETGEVEWRNGFCVSTASNYKPLMNYTIREIDDPGAQRKLTPQHSGELYEPRKRKRTDSESELQLKIVDLVERCNAESQDEDRMFLLSLLSDFKRVPIHKKLKVKSAFVTALADALE